MRHYGSIEASRGIAALGVVAYHAGSFIAPKYWGVAIPFAWLGQYGVHFFFVLSGFLMMHVHRGDIGRSERLARFVTKRFSRIYPSYWAALACVLCAFALFPTLGSAEQREPVNIARAIFLVGEPSNVLSVAWTLHHEVLFYAIFGLLIFNRMAGATLMALWFGACLIGGQSFAMAPINLLFGAGMAAALLIDRLPDFRLPRAILFLGRASYPIYLVHYPVLGLAAMALRGWPLAVGLPAAIAASISAGIAFHHAYEWARHHIQPTRLMASRFADSAVESDRLVDAPSIKVT